jgi:DNA-binding MarR family transcriptional regulator
MDDAARRAALSDLYALPGHLLWRAAARVSVELDRILPGGMDIHAYAALVALADTEPQSQRSLATVTGVSGTTVTSVAQALQRDALIERVRNPDDRRSYSLTRTAAGRDAVRRWAPHVDRLEEKLTAGFAPGEASRLRDLLVRVIGEQLDERTPAGTARQHRLPRHPGAAVRAPQVLEGPPATRHRAATLRHDACPAHRRPGH